MFRTILTKSLKDYLVATLGWGIGLGLIMYAVFAAATPALRSAYATIAPSLRFFGDPYAVQTPEGYATMRVMGLVLPALLSIWPILAGARLVRGEEERGTLDVVLATPQSRLRVILEKLSALVLALLLIALLMALGTVAGEASVGAQVDFARALLATLNVNLLAFFFCMVALLISQCTISRSTAAGWAGGLMVLSFMLDGTGRVVSETWVQYLSPFYYYNLNRPLLPGFTNAPAGALLLFGLSLFFGALSIILFVRRDSGRPAFSLQRNHTNGDHFVERSLRNAEGDVSLRTVGLRALSVQSRSSFWWLLGVVLYSFWCVLLIPSVQEPMKKALQQSPTLAKLFSGADMGTNAGFLAAVLFSFLPLLVVIFAMTLAQNWVTDLDNGYLELVLVVPKARPRILLERFGAILLLSVLAPVLTWLSVMVGAQIAHLSVDQGNVIAASFSLLPPTLIIMSMVYALAGRLRNSAVLGILTAYIFLAFLAEFLKALLQLPDWVMSLSIFYQYGSPIMNGINWGASIGMTLVAVILLAIGLIQFRYADVARG